jgi:hypothetical protein
MDAMFAAGLAAFITFATYFASQGQPERRPFDLGAVALLSVVSPATAKTHVSRAMVKLGARDRAQLVVMAYESGLIRPGWRS